MAAVLVLEIDRFVNLLISEQILIDHYFVIKSERALCDLFLRKPIVADQLTQEIITLLAPPAGEEAAIA